MLSGIVDKILISFPGLENSYRKPERVIFTGTPIRGGFEAMIEEDTDIRTDRKPCVLSFWGSLGAERMNETIVEFIKLNIESRMFDHIHATGKSDGVAEMMERLVQLGTQEDLPRGIDIREYIDDMHLVMSSADIVICRAGGSTVAELTAIGKPAVLIPSPYVSNNEQYINAQQLQKAGGAIVLDESSCTGESLYETVAGILGDENKLKSMSEAQTALGRPKAAEQIAQLILSMSARS
jgi:UDP-N-acetylglucosamine--N-acetylmuramyl-(pentapeptide) pyrophosphoryl-undecaprenol N-acetylglucosamine transferase